MHAPARSGERRWPGNQRWFSGHSFLRRGRSRGDSDSSAEGLHHDKQQRRRNETADSFTISRLPGRLMAGQARRSGGMLKLPFISTWCINKLKKSRRAMGGAWLSKMVDWVYWPTMEVFRVLWAFISGTGARECVDVCAILPPKSGCGGPSGTCG